MSTRDESPDVPESADQSSWDADLNELECEFEPRAPPAVDLLCGCAPQHDPPSPRTPGTPGRKQPFESAWQTLLTRELDDMRAKLDDMRAKVEAAAIPRDAAAMPRDAPASSGSARPAAAGPSGGATGADAADVKGIVDKTIDEINASSYTRVQLQLLYLAHRVARGDGCAYRDVAYSFGSLAGSLATMFLQFIAFSVIGDEQALRSNFASVDDDRFTMGQDDAPHSFRFAYERAAGGLPLPTLALLVFCTGMVALYTLNELRSIMTAFLVLRAQAGDALLPFGALLRVRALELPFVSRVCAALCWHGAHAIHLLRLGMVLQFVMSTAHLIGCSDGPADILLNSVAALFILDADDLIAQASGRAPWSGVHGQREAARTAADHELERAFTFASKLVTEVETFEQTEIKTPAKTLAAAGNEENKCPEPTGTVTRASPPTKEYRGELFAAWREHLVRRLARRIVDEGWSPQLNAATGAYLVCVLTFTLTPSWLLQTMTSEGHLDTGRAYGAIRLLSLVGVLPMVLGDAVIFYIGRGEAAATAAESPPAVAKSDESGETPGAVAKGDENRAKAMLFTVLFFVYEAIVEIGIVYVLLFINCISKQILGWDSTIQKPAHLPNWISSFETD